jgi:hypothetical protein
MLHAWPGALRWAWEFGDVGTWPNRLIKAPSLGREISLRAAPALTRCCSKTRHACTRALYVHGGSVKNEMK